MNETQQRIKALQAALPHLRERVIAVALLLAMSLGMMTSASFAWLTISRAPAVTGVNTTIAANGNLEIALASGNETTVTAPGESKVGDSSAAEGQSVTAANLTWGNLVNLGDPSYGLDNLALRPAQLNTAALLTSPLYGAVYSGDGRITQLTSNFGYAKWNLPEGDKPGYFGVSEELGVRAISSTKVEAVGADAIYTKMVADARDKNLGAANTYAALGNNKTYMQSLATMMGLYMTARMNPDEASLNNPTCEIEDIQNLRDMYAAFLECYDKEADAIAALVNLCFFLDRGSGNYTAYTRETVYASTTSGLKAEGVQVTALDQFIEDRNIIASDHLKLVEICRSGKDLTWKDTGLNQIVNNLVDVGKCTIGADNTPISSIGASNAMGYLSGTQEARITNGILYRFEERTGGYIGVKDLSISAKVKRMGITVPATVKANIQTTASRDYNLFARDQAYAESLNTGDYKGGIPVAQDTYGLAIDLWVRTNAQASYLTLEGNVITETETVRATGKDPDGNTVELFTVSQSVTDEETNESITVTTDLYQKTVDGTVTWYDAESHAEYDVGDATPMEKMTEVVTVIGYEGENRVWDESKGLSTDATTQGSGSCYVYYADTPEDQARSLKLLEAFKVAFSDDTGKLMATAVMDTEHYFAENGRVIVPLVLDTSDSINLGADFEGNVTYAITALEKNTPTRMTAIVYLDGTKLTNSEVLAASDIQGQLNIQFGSSQSLEPIDNEKLETAERSVSASVDKTEFDYDTATSPMTTTVTVNVTGDEPNTVTAFFLRAISATQGSREETMTFQKVDGKWVADYTFTTPGNYVLRSVRLDGVDYDLDPVPKVVVNGFTIKNLSMTGTGVSGSHANIMTAASSSTVGLSLQFATNDVSKMPKSVQGRFLREDGSATNINFSLDATTGIWSGSATFLTSGEYSLQYLVLDGEYAELDPGLWQTASVTLGMKVAVYTTSPHSFKFVPSELTANQKVLAMQVKIMDNTGEEMPGLSGAKLIYNMKGSGIKTMDTDLEWDGNYYVGELKVLEAGGPGIWQFSTVTVGSNTITNATTYPTFTIMSPEPPEYYDHGTTAYQYKPNNDAVMNAQITNSAAASVQALIVKSDGTEKWVDGTIGGELTTTDGKTANNWSFPVPKDTNGYQDGNWTLTTLRLWDVFAADGTAYTEEEPLEIDVSGTNNVTKVVSRVYVTFAEDKSQNFGKDASGSVTGAFLDSYEISGLSVDIKDFEGQAISGIKNVQLTFTYVNQSSLTNGGYTSSSLTNGTPGATITVPLTNDGSNTHFAQTSDATILYAGSYTTQFSFAVGEQNTSYTGENLPDNAPKFTVWSKAPTVKITSAHYKSGNKDDTSASSFTDTATTVYHSMSQTEICNVGLTSNYTSAKVNIYLSGYGNANNAKLTFTTDKSDGVVHLYPEGQQHKGDSGTKTDSYQWSEDGYCLRYVGQVTQIENGTDRHVAAGTLTATKLYLTFGNATYEVDIADITISNPEQ